MLYSLEWRIMKNIEYTRMYNDQIQDVLNRGVARKLSKEDIQNYSDPVPLLSHHEVLKPHSSTTPCRIIFNPSATFPGQLKK